jgi:uncharacterized protein (DUF2252 family)
MAEDAFRFYRGTCHLFYEDLSQAHGFPSSPLSWICGDLHVENFGSYKGDNRLVYFDITDFDEGILAPALWDVSRITTSIFVALEALRIKQRDIIEVARVFLRSYATVLAKGKATYIEERTAKGVTQLFLEKVNRRRQVELIRERTTVKKGIRKLEVDNIRLFAVDSTIKNELIAHVKEWLKNKQNIRHQYQVMDAGFRVAGTGSLGIKRYLLLVRRSDHSGKYLLIDMKMSMPSSLVKYAISPQPGFLADADRIVAIQQRMQNIAPALLSTITFQGEHYVVKEMQPSEDKIGYTMMRDHFKSINRITKDMALLTASAHLRSSGRQGSAVADELIEFGNAPNWQQQLLDHSMSYASTVSKDYREYLEALNDGFFR